MAWSYIGYWHPTGAFPAQSTVLTRVSGVSVEPGDSIILVAQWGNPGPLSPNMFPPAGFTRRDSYSSARMKTEIYHRRADSALGPNPTFAVNFTAPVEWATLEAHVFRGGTGNIQDITASAAAAGNQINAPSVTVPHAGHAVINIYFTEKATSGGTLTGPRTVGVLSTSYQFMSRHISWAQFVNTQGVLPAGGGGWNAAQDPPARDWKATSIALAVDPPPTTSAPAIAAGPAAYYGPTWTRTGPLNSPWALQFTATDPAIPTRTLRAQVWTGPGGTGTLAQQWTFQAGSAQSHPIAYNAAGLTNGDQTLYLRVDNSPNSGPGLAAEAPFQLKRDDLLVVPYYGSFPNAPYGTAKTWSLTVPLVVDTEDIYNPFFGRSVDLDEIRWEVRTAQNGGGAVLAFGRATHGQPLTISNVQDPTLPGSGATPRWFRAYDGAGNPAEYGFVAFFDASMTSSISLSYGPEPRVVYLETDPFQATRTGPNAVPFDLKAALEAVPVQPILWQVRTGPGLSSGTLIQNGGFGPNGEPGLYGANPDIPFPVTWTNPVTGYTFPDGERLVYLIAYNADTLQQSNALPFTVRVDGQIAPGPSNGTIRSVTTSWELQATLYDDLSRDPGELDWELRTAAGRGGQLLAAGTATHGVPFSANFPLAPTSPLYLRYWDGALNATDVGGAGGIPVTYPDPDNPDPDPDPPPPANDPPQVQTAEILYINQCDGARVGPSAPTWRMRVLVNDAPGQLSWQLRTLPGGGTLIGSGTLTPNVIQTWDQSYADPGLVNGDQTIYFRATDQGGQGSPWAPLVLRRDDSIPPNWFQVSVGDSDGSGYSLSFTATDDLSTLPGELRWEWRTAANGGGSLLAGGTATSGQPVSENVSEPGTGPRWLRITDGACNVAEREFTVDPEPEVLPPFDVPPRGCGRSVIYDAPSVTQQTGGQPRASINLCDRVPSGKYVIARSPREGLAQLAQQITGYGLRGVAIKLSSFDSRPEWRPDPEGADWQAHQAQLLADQASSTTGSQLAGPQTLRTSRLVVGGLFELGREAFESPSLAARAIAYSRNALNLDFVLIDITDPSWRNPLARNKALTVFQHVQGQYVRSRHGPDVPKMSQHCPTFAVLPPDTEGWAELLAEDGCFEPFVNGYSGPKTFAAPRLPAGSTALPAAWQWCRPLDEAGNGIGRAELIVDVRNGQHPGATVDLAVTDGATVVAFPGQRTNWTPRSGLVIYDDLDSLPAHGPAGEDPTGYWEYDGLSPLEGAVVPVYDPDPLPLLVAGRHFGAAPGTVPAPGDGSSFDFPPEVERHRAAVAAAWPADLVNKALWAIQHESGGENIQQYGGGPGTGIFQMEACTYPWGYQAYDPCPDYRPATVGDGLARSIEEQCAAAYQLLVESDVGGLDPNGKTVFYPWGELPGGGYQTGWGSFRSGFPYSLDSGGGQEQATDPPAGLPAPGSSPRVYVSTENWKTGHLGDSNYPQWAEVSTPDCGARGVKRLAGGWLELNGVRPGLEPHGTALPGGQLVLSGTPLPGDDGALPLFIEVRRSQANLDLRTKFTLVLPVADPARMPDSFGQAPSGVPINRPPIPEQPDVSGALHSHAPRKSRGRIPDVWESPEEWCLGAVSPAAEIPIPPGNPGVRPPPGTGGGGSGPAELTGCPCETGFVMTADCSWHQAYENLQAIDIGTPTGTAIYATCSGIISYRDWDPRFGSNPPPCAYRDWDGSIIGFLPCGYGVMITVDCDDGQTTMRYGHLDQSIPVSSAFPAVGDHVDPGTQIAISDNTGYSTGPHLHYEVRVNGVTVCPENLIPVGCVS